MNKEDNILLDLLSESAESEGRSATRSASSELPCASVSTVPEPSPTAASRASAGLPTGSASRGSVEQPTHSNLKKPPTEDDLSTDVPDRVSRRGSPPTAALSKLDEQIALTKQTILEVTQRKHRVLDENKLLYFTPSPKQQLFFKNSAKRRRAVFAGNRFGKSTLGVIEDICWCIGYRPFFKEGDPLRYEGIPQYSGVKILVLASDWDNVKQLFTENGRLTDKKGKIFEWSPAWAIAGTHRNSVGVIDVVYFQSEYKGKIRRSAIYFDTVNSFVNNGLSQESKDWDVVHVDEPIPKDLWKAVSRGLIDRNGSSWWLLTPLSEPWMYSHFKENAVNKHYWSTSARMEDNPTLTDDAIQLFLKDLDPVELECRSKGIPLAYGNLVISSYDEERHLWKSDTPPAGWTDWLRPPKDYYCGYAIDTHPQTPNAVLFVAIAPTDQVFIFHELWLGGQLKDRMTDVSQEIGAVTKNLRLGYELLEPAAFQVDPETGRSFADVFMENDMNVQRASKQRSYAIQRTRMLFASERKIYVFPHLRVLRKELQNWYFNKDNKPIDKDDHMCENLGRLVVHDDLRWHKPHDPKPIKAVTDDYIDSVDYNLPEPVSI